MIVWQGFGFLALLIPGVIWFLVTLLAEAVYGAGYAQSHNWQNGVALLIGAAVTYFVGEKLAGPGRELVDPATGQTVVLRRKHTLFWIPMQYVAILIAIAGVFLLFTHPAAPVAR